MKKNISILGSTGSIGLDAFKILSRKKNFFKVNILAANKNYNLICDQIIRFKPKIFIINNQETYIRVKKRFKKKNIIIINKFENQKNHFQKSQRRQTLLLQWHEFFLLMFHLLIRLLWMFSFIIPIIYDIFI